MNKLYVLCGLPGAGKSTWAKKYLAKQADYVSRDKIRYTLLDTSDDYFAKEDKVFETFVKTIAKHIEFNDTIADATHITKASRRKLLNGIRKYTNTRFEICYICFAQTVVTCKEHNQLRDGRECVPDEVIENMSMQLHWPEYKEDNAITSIWTIQGEF